jgi:hypothetical protein
VRSCRRRYFNELLGIDWLGREDLNLRPWSRRRDSGVVLNVFNLLLWCFDRLSPARSPHSGVNVSPRMEVPVQGFGRCGAAANGLDWGYIATFSACVEWDSNPAPPNKINKLGGANGTANLRNSAKTNNSTPYWTLNGRRCFWSILPRCIEIR